MFNDWGTPPINSTGFAPAANPSTSTLLAELDSTQLGTKNLVTGQKLMVRATWIVGADTNATWQIESATSTALADGVDVAYPKTATGQSGQFVTFHTLLKDYRLRARVNSTFTASAAAHISAEVLT